MLAGAISYPRSDLSHHRHNAALLVERYEHVGQKMMAMA